MSATTTNMSRLWFDTYISASNKMLPRTNQSISIRPPIFHDLMATMIALKEAAARHAIESAATLRVSRLPRKQIPRKETSGANSDTKTRTCDNFSKALSL